VLKRAPHHIGANHYYIHAVEASPDPSRAMVSADRLGALAPAAGHLVHMPAHIYVRTGRYHSAATVNQNAIAADDAFLAKSKEGGVYPLMYYTHNVHFLCYALMMEGRERDAMDAARFLETHVPLAAVRQMPMAEFLIPIPYLVAARFGRWDFILKEPAPPNDLVYTTAIWHYARALAFAAGGRYDEAARERKGLEVVTAATPADRPLGTANRAKTVSEVAVAVLAGQLSSFKGDHVAAAAGLSQAVRMQDALIYEEPPIWYFPVREALGGELLAEGRLPQAEAVLREDLKLNPNNPRSLYALSQCLRAEGKGAEAAKVEAEFNNAWRYADSKPAPIKIARAND